MIHPGMTLTNATVHEWRDAATGIVFPPGVPVPIPADVHTSDDLHVGDHLEGLSVAVRAGILVKE